jgi:murein DD-endopeptidase MepM/ murein hydrolase activator NlpD
MTVYAHLDKVAVKKGDVVSSGQKLGTVGQTGTVNKPQLHFEIRKGRKPDNPDQYLS